VVESRLVNTVAKCLAIGFAVLMVWGFIENVESRTEERIVAAAEEACNEKGFHVDCLGFGYDVARAYEKQSAVDTRDMGE